MLHALFDAPPGWLAGLMDTYIHTYIADLNPCVHVHVRDKALPLEQPAFTEIKQNEVISPETPKIVISIIPVHIYMYIA